MTPSEFHKRQELKKLLFLLETDAQNQNIINRVEELQKELKITPEPEPDADKDTE